MALETLKGVDKIGGFDVDDKNIGSYQDAYIEISHKQNTIKFKIQNGPIKENGVNGCQVDTLIETAKIMLEGLNRKFPCKENEWTIKSLDMALGYLEDRKARRVARGVEGYNKA